MPTKKSVVRQNAPTVVNYGDLQTAFDFFNKKLFGGKLPPCLITFDRPQKAEGYYYAGRFTDKRSDAKENKLDEIALNPSVFHKGDLWVLSVLVHEMTHHEQYKFGKPAKGAYHNAAWGELMDRVGLTPRAFVKGVKTHGRVGNNVTHDIEREGPFAKAYAELAKTGFMLAFIERPETRAEKVRAKVKKASKTKYTCPTCEQNAWAKPGANLICGECEEQMEAAE